MRPVSTNAEENSIAKRHYQIRTPVTIARKIIAFHELTNTEHHKRSARKTSELLEVPNSSMQFWVRQKSISKEVPPEFVEFISSPLGTAFLQQIVIAQHYVHYYGPSGIRGTQMFLRSTWLHHFVASSDGALHAFLGRCEDHIIAFGESQERQLVAGMEKRKITAALDEMFRGQRPCLVAIEAVSNFILLEKFTENRKAETWKKELQGRLEGMNIELDQIVSDQGTGIVACAKELGVRHIAELFHGQQDLTRATATLLASQERECERKVRVAEESAGKANVLSGEIHDKSKAPKGKLIFRRLGESKEVRKERREAAKVAREAYNNLKHELEEKKKRRLSAKAAIKELSKIHHPIDITSGKLQTGEDIRNKFNEQITIIETSVKQSGLSEVCENHIKKAKRTFVAIVEFVKCFFTIFAACVRSMQMNPEQEKFFNEIVFPLCYYRMIWRRLSKKDKEELRSLVSGLETKCRDGPWPDEDKKKWLLIGQECAEKYQRSSSCVEGRNGALSLYHHRFHKLGAKSVKTLTIVHNYGIRRMDGTTAANRFFGKKHDDLFESLATNVIIPGKPKRRDRQEKARETKEIFLLVA
jgi:hypothetical protein